jgi:hypothetical protein
VISETDRLADEFIEILDKNEWAKKIKPLF